MATHKPPSVQIGAAAGQLPHEPPHPSFPHSLESHWGTQVWYSPVKSVSEPSLSLALHEQSKRANDAMRRVQRDDLWTRRIHTSGAGLFNLAEGEAQKE